MLFTSLFVLSLISVSSNVPLSNFFPFGPAAGDRVIPGYNMSVGPLHLPHEFPYFDDIHNKIWITRNGLFAFVYSYFDVPYTFSEYLDGSFVAGFWHHDFSTGFNTTESQIYYQIHSNTSLSNTTVKVFNQASEYVQNFFPQQRSFVPKMVITGTWYFIGAENGSDLLNNTFQSVLCTDEDRSFVFFLYHDLQWAEPNNYYYYYSQAGLHSSNRNLSEALPYSGTQDIVKLANESNVHVPGLFAFRIDADTINAGGCNENVSMVSFRPRISSQLGSSTLIIYGPCFTNTTKVKCRFNSSSSIVNGFIIDEFRAICLTPFVSVHGSILVEISLDNGQTFISTGYLLINPLKIGSDEVSIKTQDSDNLLKASQYVNLSWHFSETVRKAFPNGTRIDILLWPVTLNNQSQLQKESAFLILEQNSSLTNAMRVSLPTNMSNIFTCFIQVIARFNNQIYAGVNTGLLIVKTNQSAAFDSCQRWTTQQPEPWTWNRDGLLPCPMVKWQAIAAGRCCYKSDAQCYHGSSNLNNCWLHNGRRKYNESSAVECYVSIYSNLHGAGAECCYDKNENLITRGIGAGTDDRYQETTSPLQHMFHDTLPYLHCCMMSNNDEACNKYMYYRPPRRGSNTMGENGRMWGDPHFGTLDGTSYTFNGHGEYIYLAISNNTTPQAVFNDNSQSYIFLSQVRTEPLLSSNVTITKGFAARSNRMDDKPISITISHRQHLLLHMNNEVFDFEDNVDTLVFPAMTISRLDGNKNSHFFLSWNIGVTIEIQIIELTSPSKQLVLNIAASVVGTFRNRTYGLLGTYDGTAANDLRSRNGTIVGSNASIKQVHEDFGITWAINPNSSLFHYELGQSAKQFEEANRKFIPSFNDPIKIDNATIRSQCKINASSSPTVWNQAQRTCYYDLSITHDIKFAQASLTAGNELLVIRKNQRSLPTFNASIPLSMSLTHNQNVSLQISATTEDKSRGIALIELHRPPNSSFDPNTGVFQWRAIEGDHYLSVEARDTTFDLTSKHDIAFYVQAVTATTYIPTKEPGTTAKPTSNTVKPTSNTVKPTSNTTKPSSTPSHGSINRVSHLNLIVSTLGMIFLFY